MSLESSFTFFLAILIFSITPGPGVFALLARSINTNFKECIPLALGMTISDIIYLILACLGLSTIANNYSLLFEFIRIAGALYLIYLAYKMFSSPIKLDESSEKLSKKSFIVTFFQGFLISASNPKVILFYIAFLPTFLDIKSLSNNDVVLVSFLAFIALMFGLMSVSLFAHQSKKYLKNSKSIKRLNYFAGSLMLTAGGFLLINK